MAKILEKYDLNIFTDKFLEQYPDFPEHMSDLGKFVYLRTYSRFLKDKSRRETWKETVRRAVEYNMAMELEHCIRRNIPITEQRLSRIRKEAVTLFESMYNLDQFLAGRTLWAGDLNNHKLKKVGLSQFNCSHVIIDSWESVSEVFYALMVGTGVGISCRLEHAEKLIPIRSSGYEVEFKPYSFVGIDGALEDSVFEIKNSGEAAITVGDSKAGWVSALKITFDLLTNEKYVNVNKISYDFSFVRPAGKPLKSFGGTASGPAPLQEMFEGIFKVLKNEIDTNQEPLEQGNEEYVKVRPVHILDICNLVGYNVVVGGVRRTAQIFLFSPEDYEVMFAKFLINGIWTEKHYNTLLDIKEYLEKSNIAYPKDRIEEAIKAYNEEGFYSGSGFEHRRMSNNSIAFIEKPSRELMMFLSKMQKLEGEPGIVNLYEASRRFLKSMGVDHPDHATITRVALLLGLNPCAEVILTSRGVCNLTTINAKNFVIKTERGYVLDTEGFIKAQQRSARAGLRMTLVEIELPKWDEQLKNYRLTGCSLTGWQDAMAMVGYSLKQQEKFLKRLRQASHEAVTQYAAELRIPTPLFVTSVKPEGTLSQVAGGVSSGLHFSHSPYFIRRIRVSSTDPLALAVKESGWRINPEVGTPGNDYYERMENARTYVIDFPIKSGSDLSKDDISALEQFEIYRMFQRSYTDMNTSNTITVKEDEWEDLFMKIYNNWDEYVGVSFLAHDGGSYQLPPYESITKEQYEKLTSNFNPLRLDLLKKYDAELYSEDLDSTVEGCESGVCPVR